MTHTGRSLIGLDAKKERENDTHCTYCRRNGRDRGLRDDASGPCHANLPGRFDDPGDRALPTAATATAASDDDLPRWVGDSGNVNLPGPAATSTAADTALRGARLSLDGW